MENIITNIYNKLKTNLFVLFNEHISWFHIREIITKVRTTKFLDSNN